MSTHFTSGLWTAFETTQGGMWIKSTGSPLIVAVCDVRNPFDYEQRANAHLIAAAPDLYESCEMLLCCMRLAGWEQDNIAINARAVLAKARGES